MKLELPPAEGYYVRGTVIVVFILVVQAVCALFFVSDILFSVLGLYLRPIAWELREYLEIGAALGLILGLVLGAIAIVHISREHRQAKEKLRRASGAFMDLLEERFDHWGLTASERDVALFAIKGMSTQEIAALRNTSEGTVKAQTNAIYRKAGVSGRPALVSLLLEDLMVDPLLPRPREAGTRTTGSEV